MAVFLPVAFMKGIVGRFLNSFGITMAFAIAVSLLVSFSLTPMLAARLLDPVVQQGERRRTLLERAVDAFYGPLERGYVAVLRWVMRHRWVIVALSVCTLGSCVPLMRSVPKGFQPDNDAAEFEVHVRAPEGTSLSSTRLLGERVAREVRAMPGVQHTLLTIGNDQQQTRNLASIYVHLVDPELRKESQAQTMERVRHEVVPKQPKELRIDVTQSSQISSGQSQAQVQYTIAGPDLTRLERYSNDILERFRKVPGAVDVDSSLVVGNPEMRVAIDREGAAYLGVDVYDVANTLALFVGGLKVSTFEEAGEDYDVHAQADPAFRRGFDTLSMLTVPTNRGGAVPLSAVAKLRPSTGPSQINRVGRQRQITITANVAPGAGQSNVSDALVRIIADEHLPPGYSAAPAGFTKETGRAVTGFFIAIGMSFVFMYLILAAQFGSWLHPTTIMLSLPLTIPFALMSLLMFHQELSLMSALGVIVLFGVVKKNAILQVDHTNHLLAQGKPRLEAILDANRDRLRPILMTTLAFVAGMLPLVLSRGTGAGLSRAIAGVVVGGQTLSLTLTLLATPVAYSLFEDARGWLRGARPRREVDRGEEELARPAHVETVDGATLEGANAGE
jgi:multidrug efflux pump subunit AcrB